MSLLVNGAARADMHYLIVGGVGGDPVYAEEFAEAGLGMAGAARRTLGGDANVTILSGENGTLEKLRSALDRLAAVTTNADRLAVFLIGHGSHDGVEYKFNLTGPDIDGSEFAERLAAIPASQLIVNASSASGAVLESWSADGRTVITATRSGRERNATHFAEHWATALSSPDADVDKNGAISAQEAFDFAARLVAESFESEGTLATEHPEIRGDAADAFEVSRLATRLALSPDVEALYDELDDLTGQAAASRLRRDELGDDYTTQMLDLQVRIARLQQQIDEATAGQ
jgi:hypothetical protein